MAAAEGEQLSDTIKARKLLWLANQKRRVAKTEESLRLYEEGLALWKKVLLANPAFHRAERSDRIEEETYEYEIEYLRLLVLSRDKRLWDRGQEEYAKAVTAVGAFFPLIGTATRLPPAAQFDWNAMIAEKFYAPFGGMMPATLPPGDSRAGGPGFDQKSEPRCENGWGLACKRAGPPSSGPASVQQPSPAPR